MVSLRRSARCSTRTGPCCWQGRRAGSSPRGLRRARRARRRRRGMAWPASTKIPPSANARRTSSPVRTPLSKSTFCAGHRRPLQWPGSASIEAGTASSCLAPWFDTTMPSTPQSRQGRTSSGCMMPLTMSGPFQRLRMRSSWPGLFMPAAGGRVHGRWSVIGDAGKVFRHRRQRRLAHWRALQAPNAGARRAGPAGWPKSSACGRAPPSSAARGCC